MLEAARPGLLATVPVVVMGGHHLTPREGLPTWGLRDDFNVQQDAVAARIVFERCEPIVVPLATSLEVALRSSHLETLRASGPLGRLIADQGERHAEDNGRRELPPAYPALPADLLNFQYDPLACAVAVGWDGAGLDDVACELEMEPDGLLRMTARKDGRPLRTITSVDALRFERVWLDAVVRASERTVP
jgi:inosine-uridine nucleoside N-ribohydrolase